MGMWRVCVKRSQKTIVDAPRATSEKTLNYHHPISVYSLGDVAELVDALRSGRSELTLVKVQVLSSPPKQKPAFVAGFCFPRMNGLSRGRRTPQLFVDLCYHRTDKRKHLTRVKV